MSHFSVAVFTTDGVYSVDDLLTPYYEGAMDDENDATPDGEISSTINPDPKWDWYEIGGRWKDMLILKGKPNDAPVNTALVADIDFEAMEKRSKSELRPYEEFINNSFYNKEHMLKCYPNKKEYNERMITFNTYAVITPDGKWHEPGVMGWFGLTEATPEAEREWDLSYFNRFLKPALEEKWHVTIVDCHI